MGIRNGGRGGELTDNGNKEWGEGGGEEGKEGEKEK